MPMPQSGHAEWLRLTGSLHTLTVGRLTANRGTDRYGRTLAVCSVEGDDLNAWMVREGWALAFVRYSTAYVKEEEKAHSAERGLWRGAFIAPWDWRHRDKGTTILGPLFVPITAQKQLLDGVTGRPQRKLLARHSAIEGALRQRLLAQRRSSLKLMVSFDRSRGLPAPSIILGRAWS